MKQEEEKTSKSSISNQDVNVPDINQTWKTNENNSFSNGYKVSKSHIKTDKIPKKDPDNINENYIERESDSE
ncbi:unnamed protein product [Brachionus calyciflorus]|uniref:Uncharacterized protein n=1 Tax=Brachionus calyciflorus TaxID=104777 RepID=A0A814T7F7_9BILA|nr:unnamed protein product [Brachionus calyciflorus]